MPRSVLPSSRTVPERARGTSAGPTLGDFSATPRVARVGSSPRVDPLLISVADARVISGLSRSELYRRMAAGDIRAVKGGTRTLIVLESLIDHLKSLPAATFHMSGGQVGQ
jgi:hypothetical protein